MCNTQSRLADELASGDAIRLVDLARRCQVCNTTCFRWVKNGLPDGTGGRAYLSAIRRGKYWLTSEAAVARFLTELPQSNPDIRVRDMNNTPSDGASGPVEGAQTP